MEGHLCICQACSKHKDIVCMQRFHIGWWWFTGARYYLFWMTLAVTCFGCFEHVCDTSTFQIFVLNVSYMFAWVWHVLLVKRSCDFVHWLVCDCFCDCWCAIVSTRLLVINCVCECLCAIVCAIVCLELCVRLSVSNWKIQHVDIVANNIVFQGRLGVVCDQLIMHLLVCDCVWFKHQVLCC